MSGGSERHRSDHRKWDKLPSDKKSSRRAPARTVERNSTDDMGGCHVY
jgi:hypothetical protein